MNYNFQKDFNNMKINNVETNNAVISIIVNCLNTPIKKIKETLLTISNQTFTDIEIILLLNKNDINLSKWFKNDKRIKVVKGNSKTIKEVIKNTSKKSEYYTIIEAGEYIEKTYLETSILTMKLNDKYKITYTDTVNYREKKLWNYQFENNILKNRNLPVPNIVFGKEVIEDLKGIEINSIRTWDVLIKLISKYNAIHQSYYGFSTYKKDSDLSRENYAYYERCLFASDIVNYPFEDYYYEIIKSNINKLSITKKQNNKKNILMIIPWMVIGGADMFNLEFTKLIDKNKYSVTIVTDHPHKYVKRQEFEEYADSVFEMSSFLDRKNWPTFLEYIIESRNIDLVLVTNSITGYNMIPYIKIKYPKLPIIDYIHSVELYNRHGGYGRDSNMMKSLLDKTLFCSKNAEESYHNTFDTNGIDTKTIYIGVDSNKFKPSNKLRSQSRKKYGVEDTINIGYICRIDYPKRPLLLAEIIRKTIDTNRKIKFIIGGDGPLLNDLKNKIKKYNLEDNVLFLGSVSNQIEFYSMCDITINCSIKEGLALTAYESLSMGVPVVSAEVGGHKELIDDSCGTIVPLLQKEEDIQIYEYSDEEIDNYVKAIKKIINNLKKYQSNSRKRIEKSFSLNTMIKNMQNEIEDTINNYKKYDNALALKQNENIVYEYMNNYFMGSQYEYYTLINRYYESFKRTREQVKKDSPEYILLKDYVKSIAKVAAFPFRIINIERKRIVGGKNDKE